ncbi:hypothetical protein HDV02_000152 [Globomyces sp. JEL0801]|nr:hypothetical protein HDV02_000152 [Globomyces sp. JEL0801]
MTEPILTTSETINHQVTGVKQSRDILGLTGKGIRVAVIDTGVYYNHPALGGGFGMGYKVEYGYDLVGDNFTTAGSPTYPDDDPIDNCSDGSHGTHVTGIIIANTTGITDPKFKSPIDFTGSAPAGVTIGAYRVFGCKGSTGDDIVAAAIRMAARAGSEIINVSIGGGPDPFDSVASIAANEVGQLGHFVTNSYGNDGLAGVFSGGGSAISSTSFSVASHDSVVDITSIIILNGKEYRSSLGSVSPPFPQLPYDLSDVCVNNLDAKSQNIENDGMKMEDMNGDCKSKPMMFLLGSETKTVIVCGNAFAFGATVCIIYLHKTQSSGIYGNETIPSLLLTEESSNIILSNVKNGIKPRLSLSRIGEFPIDTAATTSSFSSRGLHQTLEIKPDISSLGGRVFSTISAFALNKTKPAWNSAYSIMSGTSMSSPNFAGTLALFLEYYKSIGLRPDFTFIKTKIQNSAKPSKIYQSKLIDSVVSQGAGLVNIFDAITLKTTVSPSQLALNDTVRMRKDYTISIANYDSMSKIYTISSTGAALIQHILPGDDSTQTWENSKQLEIYANVNFKHRIELSNITLNGNILSILILPGQTQSITLSFIPPKTGYRNPIYSGYIIVRNDMDNQIIHVPYAGVAGDWSKNPVFCQNCPSYIKPINDILNTTIIPFASTKNLYDSNSQILYEGQRVDIEKGITIIPIISTTTKLCNVTLQYTGTDAKVLEIFRTLDLNPENLGILLTDKDQALSSYMPRSNTADLQGIGRPSKYIWTGKLDGVEHQLPTGRYRINFIGQRPFANMSAPLPDDYDVCQCYSSIGYSIN